MKPGRAGMKAGVMRRCRILGWLVSLALLLAGCGQAGQAQDGAADAADAARTVATAEMAADGTQEAGEAQLQDEAQAADASQDADTAQTLDEAQSQDDAQSADDAQAADASQDAEAMDPEGSYTSRDDVALYLHTYGRLPSNFITKAQARELGWPGGGLEEYAPGKCIGGDYFGNYEGLLPEGHRYHECDIDTLGARSRGAKRIIYSEDGLIYYTEDHYESYTLLYGTP